MFSGLYLKLALAGVLAASVLGVYAYVNGLKADLATSEANNVKLEQSIEQQQEVIKQFQADMKAKEIVNSQLRNKIKQQEKQKDNLVKKFEKTKKDGTKRDIGKSSVKKPERVKKIINKGTRDDYRCIAIASGAPLTESEINATKKSETNSQCSDIANPNYVPK